MRVFWLILNVIFWTILIGSADLLVSLFDRRGKFVSRTARIWSKIILWAGGIKYSVHGLEYLDPEKHYVFAANHESIFDIPLAFAGLPYSMVAIAKQELKKIPIFGWAMSAGGFIFVNRSRHKKALESIAAAAESLQKTPRSILLFPEGTRSKDGQVHVFKKGGFALARKAGMAIVPVACCGTREILSKNGFSFNNQEVKLRIGKPLEADRISSINDLELAGNVRDQVINLKNVD